MVDNELITKVRIRNVKSILSNVFGSSFTLSNGNGTTANGSAVDFGGTVTGFVELKSVATASEPYYVQSYFKNASAAQLVETLYENYSALTGDRVQIAKTSTGASASYAVAFYNSSGASVREIGLDQTGVFIKLGSDDTGDTYHRNASGYLSRRGVITATSTATLTPNSDTTYQSCLTAQAEALTIANPTGTPFNGQDLIVRVKDNGTAMAITFGAQFRAIGSALPTTTTISKTLYICALWNAADSKWDTVNHLEV